MRAQKRPINFTAARQSLQAIRYDLSVHNNMSIALSFAGFNVGHRLRTTSLQTTISSHCQPRTNHGILR